MMSIELKKSLISWIYHLADDDFIIGHRDSQWLGLCPDLESDVAFSSIAQDEVGHAVLYYELLHQLGQPDPDTLVFTRPTTLFTNSILLERPNKNWIYSLVRHYLYDLFDRLRLRSMHRSSYVPLRQASLKISREEYYHVLYFETFFVRLASSKVPRVLEQLQEAINSVCAEIGDLPYAGLDLNLLLENKVIAQSPEEIYKLWLAYLDDIFSQLGLVLPIILPSASANGRLGQHSNDLQDLLDEMSEVYRLDSAARW